MEKLIIEASDGYQLSALHAQPVIDPLGHIVISSATGVKKEFYINFADFLVQEGYTVLLFDYRGIGESAPLNLKTSDAFMHEWGTKDMNAVLNYLVYKKGATGIIWVGHSVGAQLIGFLHQHQHIGRVVAINSALGHWRYFPFPMKQLIWFLWYIVGPSMIRFYGYGTMKKIGWGENLPRNVLLEWRKWCLNRKYFTSLIQKKLGADKFYHFKAPLISVYTSDDFIANDITVPLMVNFFPNSPSAVFKLAVENYTSSKVGHTGVFRKKFRQNLWPVLLDLIEGGTRKPQIY